MTALDPGTPRRSARSRCARQWPRGFGLALACTAIAFLLAHLAGCRPAAAEASVHAIAMHGAPALLPGFDHLPYARPDAPKGGELRLGDLGTFDSLNPFIIKGVSPSGIREYVYESLLSRSSDEPFTLYAHLARAVEMPDDRGSITFHLDPDARFSDGHPVTVDDVLFSWRLLKERGQPYHRAHYSTVARAESPAPGSIRFEFGGHGNREAPLLIALMPILPRHRIDPATFDQTTLEPPVGSGPYRVTEVDAGRSFTLERNRD